MGLTMAEAFILIAFALLLLFALWQWETTKENTEAVEEFKNLTAEQKATALNVTYRFQDLDQQQLERVEAAIADGVFQDPSNSWRFISETDLKRLIDGAQRLPEDVRRQLADLVTAQQAEQVLSELGALERIVEAGQSLSDISNKIRQSQSQEIALANSLRDKIGDIVAGMDGEISDDGSITLPESVVFQQGSPQISPRLRQFLRRACEPWLRVLRSSEVEVFEVRIEGHASSEWRLGASLDQAYLGNLELSQKRSQNVLLNCLNFISDDGVKAWARAHLVAVGHSSARPVLNAQGVENPEKSRRVVFRATPNREVILEDIGQEAQEALTRLSYSRDLFGTWVDEDGDCFDTRHEILQSTSIAKVELSEDGCRVVEGRWRDPYSGVVLTRASSIEIDHMVPLAWAWKRGASGWTDEKRQAFYRDRANLIATESTLNRAKADNGPDGWIPPNEEFQCEYLERFLGIVEKYSLELAPTEKTHLYTLRAQACR